MTRNIHLYSDLHRAVKAILLAEKELNDLTVDEITNLTMNITEEVRKYITYQEGLLKSKTHEK